MTTSQLQEELGALAGALAKEKELGWSLRTALEQYRDISTWKIKLPDDIEVQKTLAEIWHVREELKRRNDIVRVIAEGLRILRIFLPLPI